MFDGSYGDFLHRVDGLVGFLGDTKISLLIQGRFKVLRVLYKLKVGLRGGGLEFRGLMIEALEVSWRLLLESFLCQLIAHVETLLRPYRIFLVLQKNKLLLVLKKVALIAELVEVQQRKITIWWLCC